MHYLIVPGLNNSGPDHWQSYWAKSLPNATRVVQRNWDHPQKETWIETLDEAASKLDSETIFVSHSLGVVTTVHWLLRRAARGGVPAAVKGLFLVSPSDPDEIEIISSFAPMPLGKLPVPACVVASENDPFVRIERARFFAESWGAKLFEAGALGHINAKSNLGEWEQGRAFLAEFEGSLGIRS